MSPDSGEDRTPPPEGLSLSSAGGDFGRAASAYLRALGGLLGLELRESGSHVLLLAGLALGFAIAATLAYLFLIVAMAVSLASWMGGGWFATAAILFIFHLLVAAVLLLVLVKRGRRPLFPGTREAVRREISRIS
ncbi:MAG: hypothetical protein FGM15_00250 [Chthoniobacterales bacterium]|nr:hypothetical protein [Chthoniobacterales bacterium]